MPSVEEVVEPLSDSSASTVSSRPLSRLWRFITRKKTVSEWLWVAGLVMIVVEVGAIASWGNHYAVNQFSPDGNGVGFGA